MRLLPRRLLDAFSLDSIPVHLPTHEAFEVYDAALDENGMVAVHIANRHIDLWTLVQKLGQELSMHGLNLETAASPPNQSQVAKWRFLSRDKGQLEQRCSMINGGEAIARVR